MMRIRSASSRCFSIDGYIQQLIFPTCSIELERKTMNDATVAEMDVVESTEASDFVEMGKVSEETKGNWDGDWDDGGVGCWF